MPVRSLRGPWFNLQGGQCRAGRASPERGSAMRMLSLSPFQGWERGQRETQLLPFGKALSTGDRVGFLKNDLSHWDFGDCHGQGALAEGDDALSGPMGLSCCASSAESLPLPAPWGARDGDKAMSQQGSGTPAGRLPSGCHRLPAAGREEWDCHGGLEEGKDELGFPCKGEREAAVSLKQENKELFVSPFLQAPFNLFILPTEDLVDEIWSESRDLKAHFCSAGNLLTG